MRKSLRDHKSSLASELAHIAEETWGIRVRVSDTRGVLKLTDSRAVETLLALLHPEVTSLPTSLVYDPGMCID